MTHNKRGSLQCESPPPLNQSLLPPKRMLHGVPIRQGASFTIFSQTNHLQKAASPAKCPAEQQSHRKNRNRQEEQILLIVMIIVIDLSSKQFFDSIKHFLLCKRTLLIFCLIFGYFAISNTYIAGEIISLLRSGHVH